jgi:membrane associated rhomboid family serine protease
MFPIGDDREAGGGAPLVVIALVVLNVLAFLLELSQSSEGALQSFIQAWGVVPHEYAVRQDLPPHIPLPFWSTLFTSMFLHAGWMHLGGNMLYLWIFGDNLERVMGPARFLLFYLICGIAAGLAQILASGASNIPSLGASGAISGVLGGYLVLFPRNRVRVLTRGGIMSVPAVLVLGLWIVIQMISGLGTIANSAESGGVAYMAHIGGFVAGLLLVKAMTVGRPAASIA